MNKHLAMLRRNRRLRLIAQLIVPKPTIMTPCLHMAGGLRAAEEHRMWVQEAAPDKA